MLLYDVPIYGPQMAATPGWVARLGDDQFAHTFGGSSWDVSDPNTDLPKPTLLMTLDLKDPRISLAQIQALPSLPICSHINCDIWTARQIYQIHPDTRTVTLISGSTSPELLNLFPNPLPERRISMHQMDPEDYPINEDMYGKACDKFLGTSSSFIRVLGPPLWMQWAEEEFCECGLRMEYICSIGREDYYHPSGIIPNQAFFIGEAALYFFFCPHCLKVVVTSQSS